MKVLESGRTQATTELTKKRQRAAFKFTHPRSALDNTLLVGFASELNELTRMSLTQ